MKKSKTNVFRILSVILMLVMVVSVVNGNTVSAKRPSENRVKEECCGTVFFRNRNDKRGGTED